MNMFQAVRAVLRKYADFTGTASRSEFWWFALFSAIGHLVLNALNIVTAQGTVYLGASLSGAFGLAIFIPTLAVAVRRLRDAGRSWAELFWLLLPIAGLIVLIVHLADPSRQPVAVPVVVSPSPVTT